MSESMPTGTPPASRGSPSVWGRFDDFQHEMNRMVDRFFRHDFRHFGLPTRLKGFDLSPTVDVRERDGAYEITAEVPGISEKDVNVSVEGRILTISGEKKHETVKDEKGVHISERQYGSFQRIFTLPDDADADQINAACARGVLTVTIPRSKKPVGNAKQIRVVSG